MADPLSVIASVIAVGSLAAQSFRAFYQLIDAIVDAPNDICALSRDAQSCYAIIASLNSALLDQEVRATIEGDVPMMEVISNLENPLHNCLVTLDQMRLKLLTSLKPVGGCSRFRLSSVALRWWLNRSRFKDSMDRLGQNKATLNVSLAAITT